MTIETDNGNLEKKTLRTYLLFYIEHMSWHPVWINKNQQKFWNTTDRKNEQWTPPLGNASANSSHCIFIFQKTNINNWQISEKTKINFISITTGNEQRMTTKLCTYEDISHNYCRQCTHTNEHIIARADIWHLLDWNARGNSHRQQEMQQYAKAKYIYLLNHNHNLPFKFTHISTI